jgi:hypothetical protein
MNMEQRPRAGVGVMIFKDGKVLIIHRMISHGAGDYGFSGGTLKIWSLVKNVLSGRLLRNVDWILRTFNYCISRISKSTDPNIMAILN